MTATSTDALHIFMTRDPAATRAYADFHAGRGDLLALTRLLAFLHPDDLREHGLRADAEALVAALTWHEHTTPQTPEPGAVYGPVHVHSRHRTEYSRYETWDHACGCSATYETAVVDLGQGDAWCAPCRAHMADDERAHHDAWALAWVGAKVLDALAPAPAPAEAPADLADLPF